MSIAWKAGPCKRASPSASHLKYSGEEHGGASLYDDVILLWCVDRTHCLLCLSSPLPLSCFSAPHLFFKEEFVNNYTQHSGRIGTLLGQRSIFYIDCLMLFFLHLCVHYRWVYMHVHVCTMEHMRMDVRMTWGSWISHFTSL